MSKTDKNCLALGSKTSFFAWRWENQKISLHGAMRVKAHQQHLNYNLAKKGPNVEFWICEIAKTRSIIKLIIQLKTTFYRPTGYPRVGCTFGDFNRPLRALLETLLCIGIIAWTQAIWFHEKCCWSCSPDLCGVRWLVGYFRNDLWECS